MNKYINFYLIFSNITKKFAMDSLCENNYKFTIEFAMKFHTLLHNLQWNSIQYEICNGKILLLSIVPFAINIKLCCKNFIIEGFSNSRGNINLQI